MNCLNDIIYNMQAPSPKPQQVKAWALTSPLDNPSFSIRYNTSSFNTASVLTLSTCWAWGGGSCQTWVKSRIKEGEWGKRKKVPFLKSGLKTRLGEDICVFKWNTINLTSSGGFQSKTYQTVLHFHKAATWKMSILRLRLRPISTADLYRSSPGSNHHLWQTSIQEGAEQREQYRELSSVILATQLSIPRLNFGP